MFLCFTDYLITSKQLIEHILYNVLQSYLSCSQKCHLVITMSQGKEKLVLCSNTLSLSFTTQNHPYKCMGAFKSNTCYRRIRAQKVLSSTTQSVPLRIYVPDQRGREANSSQTFLIGPKELITCGGRRGSHVHIYPPECKSRGSQ